MPDCENCGRGGAMLLSTNFDTWLCDNCSDKHWTHCPEWAYAARELTPVVINVLFQEYHGELLRRPFAGPIYFVARMGAYRVGDTVTLPPNYGQHTADPTARYTVRVTALGPTSRTEEGTVAVYYCEILESVGHADWHDRGAQLLTSTEAAELFSLERSTTRKAANSGEVEGSRQEPRPGTINPPWVATRGAWQKWYDNRRPVGRPPNA